MDEPLKCHILERHNEPVNAICFSQDGHLLASVSVDREVNIIDLYARRLHNMNHGNLSFQVTAVALSPNRDMLAANLGKTSVAVWNISQNTHREFHGHRSAITSLAFSPDGKHLASSSNVEGSILIWDLQEWREAARLDVGDVQNDIVGFRHDGSCLKVKGGLLSLRDFPSGRLLLGSDADTGRALCCDMRGGWILDCMENTLRFPPSRSPISIDVFGDRVAVGDRDGYISIFKISSGQELV